MNRRVLVLLAVLWSPEATTEAQWQHDWDIWHFGAPCSTKTDIEEGTCNLKVKKIFK